MQKSQAYSTRTHVVLTERELEAHIVPRGPVGMHGILIPFSAETSLAKDKNRATKDQCLRLNHRSLAWFQLRAVSLTGGAVEKGMLPLSVSETQVNTIR